MPSCKLPPWAIGFQPNGKLWSQFGIHASKCPLHFHLWARELEYLLHSDQSLGEAAWLVLGCLSFWPASGDREGSPTREAPRRRDACRYGRSGQPHGNGEDLEGICFMFIVGVIVAVSGRFQSCNSRASESMSTCARHSSPPFLNSIYGCTLQFCLFLKYRG